MYKYARSILRTLEITCAPVQPCVALYDHWQKKRKSLIFKYAPMTVHTATPLPSRLFLVLCRIYALRNLVAITIALARCFNFSWNLVCFKKDGSDGTIYPALPALQNFSSSHYRILWKLNPWNAVRTWILEPWILRLLSMNISYG
jgi:hypothetical protein